MARRAKSGTFGVVVVVVIVVVVEQSGDTQRAMTSRTLPLKLYFLLDAILWTVVEFSL